MADTPETTQKVVKILVVEDSPTQLEELRFLLEASGFSVVATTNGKEALAAAKANAIDLVISDIVMPEMDGYALCKALRADETLRNLPVILLTSLAEPREVIRGLESGANNFICKPYDDRALLARAHNVLANQEIRKASHSEMGVSIFFAGQRFFITADRLQILDLLLSTYENAVNRNTELIRARDELQILNEQLEARVAKRTAMLAERVKELKCLSAISSLVVEPCGSINESLKAAADLIPPGWQYPEIIGARIVFEGREFASANFRDTAWKQSADIVISGKTVGTVEVCSLEGRPALEEGPCLKEKRELINDIARQLGGMIERQRAEEALRESEERLRAFVENAPVGIYRTTPDGRVLMANPTLVRMLGYDSFQELASRNLESEGFEPSYPRSAFRERIEREGEVKDLEGVWMRRDGSPITVRESAMVVRANDGRVLHYEGIVEDITERRRAEEALRESEERARIVAESVTDVIYAWDLKDKVDWYGDVDSLMGYPAGGFPRTRDGWAAALHPEDKERVRLAIENQLKGAAPYDVEYRIAEKDGGWRWWWARGTVLRDEQGQPRCWIGAVTDITEHKRAEVMLQRLKMAVDNSDEVVFMTDREGIITFINPEFTRLYGYAEAEVVGKVTPRILKSGSMQPEDYANFWSTILEKRVAKGEIINRAKDGRFVTVESSANPIPDEQGAIIGFLAIQRDVTARKLLERQFLQAQKMEAVGRLAGGIAHDFNNLLTVINGYSQLLLERLDAESLHRRPIEEIQKAGERATSLTRQLLAFSRKQIVVPQVADLNAIVPDIEKMLRRLIGEDLVFLTVLHPNLGKVKVDPGQIEQVLTNLVVNARDAMPQGGRITIETADVELDATYVQTHSGVTAGRYVMLAVSDTGHGMDAETQSHIFEPFYTTKEAGKGTGLGLATVYGIVKQSGGNIWVYSEPGEGTVVKIYLPRVEEAGAAEGERQQIAAASGGSETILVTEDQDAVRLLVCEVLKSKGYEVLEASQGEEALRIARAHPGPIHLLVTDVVMPGMSGRELARNLAVLRPEMKVLYMSGYTGNAIVHHGVLEEGLTFIQKPFTPDALAGQVREVLAAAPLEEA